MPGRKECLICRSVDGDGRIVFLTYDRTDEKIHEYSNDEITRKIVDRQIVNAKLENTVVKITDTKTTMSKIRADEKKSSNVFYILDSYTSVNGSAMFLAVSNCGEKFEFSENLAADFCGGRHIVNGYMTKNGLKMINVPAYVTALNKSLEHAETD
ncbi:MAG: hypothetical protein NC395_10930 [Prevotella sp.]|nr:hypothetical protein [Prevotella sp.]